MSSGASNAILITVRRNALNDSTSVAYSARNRPVQDTLPRVLDETGASVRPVIQYAPQETRALGTLISADSVYVSVTDPRGNWTRSALNRWGSAIRSWDALGAFGLTSYTPEGRVVWSEGKVADSTRVYHSYDVHGRRVRSYRYRTVSDIVRLDSLVYDANHRVIRSIDPRGKVSHAEYDGEGHVIRTITPTNDTSRIWYRADGLVDSTRGPEQSGATRLYYDATWKNNYLVTDAQGRTLVTRTFDNLGRAVQSERRVATRSTRDSSSGVVTDYYEWVRSRQAFNAAGQVTSSYRERSNECTPCNGGTPGWLSSPTTADSARYDSVQVVYSRVGRDSIRYNIRRQAVVTVYDALGRLRRRYPWFTGDSTLVDSMRYDVAGNLRYSWSRRGHQIDRYYDSRNRDTATVVPGIGTYRSTFGGPNDELTRRWIDGYVDSIGGVNPELRWGYGQAGQLLADTSQGNRVTTYLYDRFMRDSVVTDAVGAWGMRYDADRGALDTIITPYADTVAYWYDARSRLRGPTITSGSGSYPLYAAQNFSSAAQLRSMMVTQNGFKVGGMENVDTTDVLNRISMGWVEQHGSSDSERTAVDTLVNDGFGRNLSVRYFTLQDSLVAVDTFLFDRDGAIRIPGESRGYDTLFMRMTSRAGDSYSYDNAGNLTGADSWAYGYDALERLIWVRYGAGGTLIARYAYDVAGRRIVRRVYGAGPNSATTGYFRMIYRGGLVTAETDSAGGSLTVGYVWGMGADDLLAVHDYSSGHRYYAAKDQLGSVRALTRRDGVWTAALKYRSYGQVMSTAGTIPFRLRYRWIGREFDEETGFYYLRARYFDPASQRFTQEDPIGYAGGSNVYAYGDGNPTNGRDLNGLRKEVQPYGAGPNPFSAWTSACFGMTGGCYEGDIFTGRGSWWSWLDSELRRVDRNRDYDAYLRGWDERCAGQSTPACDPDNRLRPGEFDAAWRAVNLHVSRRPVSYSGIQFGLSNVLDFLRSGVIWVDRSGDYVSGVPGANARGFPPGFSDTIALLPHHLTPAFSDVAVQKHQLADIIVHEALHNWDRGQTESTVCAAAVRLTGYTWTSGPCSQ